MQSSFSTERRGLFLALVGAVGTVSGASFGAPAPPSGASGMVVTATERCRVSLVALSYDDPGADDAEFLELRVEDPRGAALGALATGFDVAVNGGASTPEGRPSASAEDAAGGNAPGAVGAGDAPGALDAAASACDAPAHTADAAAATRMDAGGADGAAFGPPTLGDCGLGELRLVDGGSGACEEYRAIPLAGVVIPRDGFVVLCPSGSTVDMRAHCDVTAAGRLALRGGWLQNGPTDGLRFVDTGARTALEIGYEGALSCFAAGAPSLAPESGQQSTEDATDDVNAACGGRFVLLSEADAPLRASPHCPPPAKGAVTPVGAADGGSVPGVADAAAPWVPERAPAPPPPVVPRGPTTILFDGGAVTVGKSSGALPRPPGCSLGLSASSTGDVGGRAAASAAALVGLSALFRLRRRKRRSRAEPRTSRVARARCVARYGSGPRRSPSR